MVWSEDWNPSNFAISGTVTDGTVGNLTDRSGWLNVSYNIFSSQASRPPARFRSNGLGLPCHQYDDRTRARQKRALSQRMLQHGRDWRRRGDGLDDDHRTDSRRNLLT